MFFTICTDYLLGLKTLLIAPLLDYLLFPPYFSNTKVTQRLSEGVSFSKLLLKMIQVGLPRRAWKQLLSASSRFSHPE